MNYSEFEWVADLAIQCTIDGQLGDFLFVGEIKDNPRLVSPVFKDLAQLFLWIKENKLVKINTGNMYMPKYGKPKNL
jgi:hypothetical protein